MLRKLVLWILMVPMPLNGLWMVCKDAPSDVQQPVQSAKADEGDDCAKICALHHPTEGAICLISAGNSKSSIQIVVFGVPILPGEIQFRGPEPAGQSSAELKDLYLDPASTTTTPPPRA
jgi:hypothetical protein